MKRAKKWIGFGLSVLLLFQPVGYVNAEESSGESQEQILSLAEVSTEVKLDIGEKKEENIYYTVAPDVTRPQDILCTSSDENIASIEVIAGDADADGLMVRIRITGKATGHADIMVSLNETGTILEKYSVEVSSEKASTEVKLDIGEKKEENIYYTVAPDVTRPQDILCESSDENIASIEAIAGDADADGLMVRIRIIGKATGHADMKVSLNETGTILGKYSVEVSDTVYNDETNEYGTVIVKGNCGAPQIDRLTWTIYDTDENGIGDTLVIDGLGAMKDYSPTSAPWQAYKESLEQLILGPGVTHIGEYAFTNCENLTGNLFLSEVLTSIGRYAFYKCNFYGHLIIPNSVTTIGNSAFRDCKAFSGLSLSNNLSKIESSVFDGCSGFTGNLVIPSSVTNIENSAFSYCSNFTGDLVIPDSVTNIGNNAFAFWGKSRGKLILPSELKSVPDGCFYMSGFTGDLFLPQTVTLIGSYAFGENKFTGELKLPGKLKLISKSAFAGCEYLSGKVVLPESVESIGDSIFSRCSRLNGIVILNRECNIAGGESAIPANFNIYGYAASTAQEYATTYGRTFIKDHDYICTEKKATCTEGGLKTYTCSICGDMYTEETSELKHSYSTKWTVDKAATCTEKGSQSRHCTRCNEKTDITEIAELGHTYGEPKFIWSEDNAICNAEFICTTCGNIEELSCAITEDIKAAACTEVGERIYTATCTHNNQVYRSEKKVNIPAEGHTYGEPQFIWSEDNTTCNAEVICSTCDNVESLNCEVSTDVPDITCTEGGEIVYTATCIYENKEYTDEKKVIAPSNGHTYGAPKFEWSEDHQTCIAVFECVVGDDKQQEDCQVNSKVTIGPYL